MKTLRMSNRITLPRKYIVGEQDIIEILFSDKLRETESLSSINVKIFDDEDEDRTSELLVRSELIQRAFDYTDYEYVGLWFKTGIVDEDETDLSRTFKIKITAETTINRTIIIEIKFIT